MREEQQVIGGNAKKLFKIEIDDWKIFKEKDSKFSWINLHLLSHTPTLFITFVKQWIANILGAKKKANDVKERVRSYPVNK